MQPNRQTLLCRYYYDPLDRLVDCTPSAQSNTQRFYLKDRLATEIQGTAQRSIMQHEDQLLAQQQRQSGAVSTRLFATDQQRSVLKVLDGTQLNHLAYTAYGHRPPENGLLSLLGFSGERPDPVTGCYLLGNGYRAFNPVLMRFNSPDSWSPFGEGGLNSYAYCAGEPVNRSDATGHMFNPRNRLALSPPRPSRIARALPPRKTRTVNNINRISDTLKIYEDHNGARLNIDAHGINTPSFKSSRVLHDGELLDARNLYSLIKKHADADKYSDIRLLICNSANGGSESLAAGIARLSKKPTKGFLGEVIVENNLELLTESGLLEQKRVRMQPNNNLPPIVDTLVDKSSNYRPKKFYP